MKQKFYLLLFFVVLSLVSCKPLSYLMVDLTEPPREVLPESIQSLTLVNRAVDKRFTDDLSDSIQLRFYKSQFNLDTLIYDIKASDTLMQAMGNLLFESGRFDIVIPENRFLMKDSCNLYADSMKWEDVEDFTERFNTDAVLSLDFMKTEISTVFGIKKYRSWINDNVMVYYAAMNINYMINIRLYYPDNKSIFSYFLVDTLHWEDQNYELESLFIPFTPVKTALSEAGISAAMNLSSRIAPTWNSYKRGYFSTGNKLLHQTKPMVLQNDWETSRQLWMGSLDKIKSKTLRSKLEFNIALTFEMQGNLDEAIRWGVKSYESCYRTVTYDYLNTLKARKAIIHKTDENNK
jgi:hypothetical protein